jgi:hypothetical protein
VTAATATLAAKVQNREFGNARSLRERGKEEQSMNETHSK